MSIALESSPAAPRPPAGGAGRDALVGLLAALRRQARGWIWIESLALACLCGGGVFWGSLLLDWSSEPPARVRMALAAATALGLAWLLWRKLVSRLAVPMPDEALALAVERRHPAFRDSLSTAIELAGRPRDDVDPELLARTTDEAVAMLGQVRPGELFKRRRLAALTVAALGAVASIGLLAAMRPAVADLWTRRMILFADDPWPRRIRLSVDGFVDGVRKVARGSDVDVIVRATAGPAARSAADWLPSVVDLRSRGLADGRSRGGWKTERMGMRGGETAEGQAFGHVLKGVDEDLVLEVRGGDARIGNLRLAVVEAPTIESLEIDYTLPAYLGGGRRRAPPARIVQVPRGSRVDVTCRSTKPLSAASILAVAVGGRQQERPGGAGEGQVLASLPVAGDGAAATALSGGLESLDGDCSIVVRLTDTDGLVNREPITFILSAVPDEPPQVAVRMRGISTAVTPQARIPLEGTIADDHALAASFVRLRVAEGRESTLPIARVRDGAAVVELPAAAPEVVALEPLGLAPGRTLEVAVVATDGCTLDGLPNTAASDPWSLAVVTPEALTAMLEAREIILRRRFESCIADLAQARDRLADGDRGDAGPAEDRAGDVPRLGESASRAAGETAEIAAAFRDIRLELDNNSLLTPELDARLVVQIADPLAAIAAADLPALAAACRQPAAGPAGDAAGRAAARLALARQADDVLARMRSVLDRMMELESFNEVIELLRGVIRTQEEIKAETLRRQKQRAREALEQP